MSDLIDREQAKDAIDKYLVGRNLVTDGTFMARLINEIVIDRLPSAQPTFDARDTQYNLPIGTDLISRQAAIDALRKMQTYKLFSGDDMLLIDQAGAQTELMLLPSAQPEHCGDAVSRNAIVQKLNKMDRYVSAELRLCDTDKKFPQNEVFIVDDVYEEIVEQLPSVQPKKGRWISADAMFHGVPFYCSECGENTRDTVMGKPRWKFCPMCGSRNEVTE